MKKILSLIIITLVLCSCASKRYTKKAVKFEQAGLFQDAAEYYYQAVLRKQTNLEAKIGLQKNGQLNLDSKLNNFESSYKNANLKQAVYSFIEANNYYKKLKNIRVNLNLENKYREYYEEVKLEYLDSRYAQALDILNRDEFKQSRVILTEILSIDNQYKDAAELRTTSIYEPVYRQANNLLDIKEYRKAYYLFDKIIRETQAYKESLFLKNQAQEKATISIAVLNTNTSRYSYKYRTSILNFENKLKANINQLKSPFIKLINIDDNIIYKGKINMKMARLSGIKAILKFNINDILFSEGKIKETYKKGYIKETIKKKNKLQEETITYKYNKTRYSEIYIENRINLTANYKMISTDDNSIMMSDIIKLANADKVHYAKYLDNNNIKKLVPGYWVDRYAYSDQDVVKDNKTDINHLHILLKARREIRPIKLLHVQIIDESTRIISNKLNKYIPKR